MWSDLQKKGIKRVTAESERERRTFKKERKDRRVKMRGGKNGKSERSWRLGGVFLGVWL